MSGAVEATPKIIHVEVPQDDWSELGELAVTSP